MNEKSENQNVSEPAVIETVADLEARYPGLVAKIRDDEIEKISAWPIEKVRKKFPALIQRIGKKIGPGKRKPDLRKPGFLLSEFSPSDKGEDSDPFAAGTLRYYKRLKNVAGLELPFVLPFSDSFTRAALENYILRAEGGGDYERANKAKAALSKCK